MPNWIEAAFNRSTLAQLRDKPIVCAGVTIGPATLMIDYLEKMIELFIIAPGSGWDTVRMGIDQAAHNFIVHNHLLPRIRLHGNDDGPVLTAGIESSISVNHSGVIVNRRGNVQNIVHQYDRHWAVARRFYGFSLVWLHHWRICKRRWARFRAASSRALRVRKPALHRILVAVRNALF